MTAAAVSPKTTSKYLVDVEWSPYGQGGPGHVDLAQAKHTYVTVEADSDHEATLLAAQMANYEGTNPIANRPDGMVTRTTILQMEAKTSLLEGWRPTRGMFEPGRPTLDPRVFDGDRMHPEIRQSVLAALDGFWRPRYGNWAYWAKPYLAGSGASHWWDSDADMDILVGVDLDRLRKVRPKNQDVSDDDIVAHLDHELKEELDPQTVSLNGFTTTYFVNAGSYDIRAIKPYAAYDLVADDWVVHPPVLPPDWGPHYIPDDVWRQCEQQAREAEAVLALLDPASRHQACVALFDHWHSWRHLAYTEHGKGWLDTGNINWQFLSQRPDRLLQRLYAIKHEAQPGDQAVQQVPGVQAALGVLQGESVFGWPSTTLSDVQVRGTSGVSRTAEGRNREANLQGLWPEATGIGVSRASVSSLSVGMASPASVQSGAQGAAASDRARTTVGEVRSDTRAVRRDVDAAGWALRDVPDDRTSVRGSLSYDGSSSGHPVHPLQHRSRFVGGQSGGSVEDGASGRGVPRGIEKHNPAFTVTAARVQFSDGTLPGQRVIFAEDAEGNEIGFVRFTEPGVASDFKANPAALRINQIKVDEAYQRQGIATALMNEVLRRYPGIEVEHSKLSDDGSHFRDTYEPAARARFGTLHIAGPVSDRIPQAMRRMIPDRLLSEPRPVVLDRPAEDDLKRLPGDVRNALVAAMHALEDGKANVEAKTRALAGAFTVRLTAAWRAVLYIGQDLFWHCFAVVDHDYGEVQRRFSMLKGASPVQETEVKCPNPQHYDGDGLNPLVWDEANGYQHNDGSCGHEDGSVVSDWVRPLGYVKQVRNMEPGETIPGQRSFSGEDEAIEEIVPGPKYVKVTTDAEEPNTYAFTPKTRLVAQ